ncbi:MAG: hypothetical protein JSU65_03875, partial [Candidatus Zixiibacteriota bacterium]
GGAQGGCGGHSYCVWKWGSSDPVMIGTDFTYGSAGQGGVGGFPGGGGTQAPSGGDGGAGEVWPN